MRPTIARKSATTFIFSRSNTEGKAHSHTVASVAALLLSVAAAAVLLSVAAALMAANAAQNMAEYKSQLAELTRISTLLQLSLIHI